MRDGSEEVRYGVSGAPAERDAQGAPDQRVIARAHLSAGWATDRARWGGYATRASLALLAVAVAVRLWQVTAAATDYDEGVYWQSLRAMSHGHPLFTSVFSSQPPVFVYGIYPFYLALGQSLAAARIGVVLFSLIGILAAYGIGRMAAGHGAGLLAAVLLALDPLYQQESRTLQAEVPALCWALVGIAFAMAAARGSGGRRHWLALAAGIAIALGIGAKLFDVVALVPAVLYLAAPIGATLVGGEDRLVRPNSERLWAATRASLPDLGVLVAGIVVGTLLYVAPYIGVWPSFYDQVISFHLRASQFFATGLKANVRVLASVGGEVPIELVALAAVGVAAWRRMWGVLPLVLWAAASLLLLLDQHPLFTHHVALLVPPLAVLIAAVAITAWQQPGAPLVPARAALASLPARVPTLTIALVAALALWGLVAGMAQAAQAHGPSAQQVAIADTIAATTQAGDYVLSDDQYLAALAGRDVPPQLVDTSTVRIQSGYLTVTQLEQAAQDPNVREVLFASGRFDEVPGFRTWVASHFASIADFGGGVTLYARVPHAPVAA